MTRWNGKGKFGFVALLAGAIWALGTGCETQQVQALLIGIEAATGQLEEDDDISFSDWLSSELDD